MTRALLAVGALLALAFLILGLVVFVTREEDRVAVDNVLAENLTRAIGIADARDGAIDLARVAPFEWDRVFVVQPGTAREDVSAALGTEYKGDLPFASFGAVFVFARGSVLARFADYRGRATFAGFEEPIDELPRARARLTVRDLVVSPP